jgi:hypothetical protein
VQQRKDRSASTKIAERDFSDDKRMNQNASFFQKSGEVGVGAAKMVDPD